MYSKNCTVDTALGDLRPVGKQHPTEVVTECSFSFQIVDFFAYNILVHSS